MKRVALYARVSTDKQTTENQLVELRRTAMRNDWVIVDEFVDEGISGAKGRDKRPQFDALLKSAVRKEFDLIMSWSVDRLGRSLQHLVEFLNEIHSKNIDLYLHQQGLDTTTPAGRMMFQMCGVFAEFERTMIRDRILAGQQRAKANGTHIGRKSKIDDDLRNRVIDLKQTGMGMRGIASEAGLSLGSVHKILVQWTSIRECSESPSEITA